MAVSLFQVNLKIGEFFLHVVDWPSVLRLAQIHIYIHVARQSHRPSLDIVVAEIGNHSRRASLSG